MAKLNRKERRLLEFGTLEERVALAEKWKASEPPKFVVERDGYVLLPVLPTDLYRESVLSYMIPHDKLDPKYNVDGPDIERGVSHSTIGAYRTFVRDWFHVGLKSYAFEIKPTVVLTGVVAGNIVKLQVLLQYLRFLLDTRESQHNHKLAYCAYVLDMCCESVTWERKDQS